MLCQERKADNLSHVGVETLLGECLIVSPGATVIGIRMDGYATSRGEKSEHFDVLGIHQLDQVIEDNIHAILMETAMVAETEEVELQALTLHHPDVGNITDPYLRKIGLPCDRAKGRELRAVELHPIIPPWMHVLEGLKDLRSVIHLVTGLMAKGRQTFFLPVFHIFLKIQNLEGVISHVRIEGIFPFHSLQLAYYGVRHRKDQNLI